MFRRTEIVLAIAFSLASHGSILAAVNYLNAPRVMPLPPKRMQISLTRIDEHKKNVVKPKVEKQQKKKVVRKPKKVTPRKPKKVVKTPQPKRTIKPVAKAVPLPPTPFVEEQVDSQVNEKAQADYSLLIVNWLERHRRYPKTARRRNQEGRGVLQITLACNGSLLSANIDSSTGVRALDLELSALAKRAEPYPKCPSNIRKKSFSFSIPIQFKLRN